MLSLAFFIYGIFNPSWAARLWYNVRTFPSRMASRMWSGKEFLDYNTYKSKISSIWDDISDSISDKIDDIWDEIDLDFDDESIEDFDLEEDENDVEYDENDNEFDEDMEYDYEDVEDAKENKGKNVIKTFPRAIKFVEIPEIRPEIKSGNNEVLPWYSRTDLLWIINRYLEKNLDDDTDILVTVEYDEDSADPQKIILQTQPKSEHSVSSSNNLMEEVFPGSDRKVPEEIEIIPAESSDLKVEESRTTQKQAPVQKQSQTIKKTTSTKLTQKEQEEAEEIFWILF